MKMSFPLGDAKALSMPIDYRTFVAGIIGQQSMSRTATVAARLISSVPVIATVEALAAMILVGQGPADAAVLKGSFHPAAALRLGGKVGSTNMKPAFTFAFQRSFNAVDVMTDRAGGPKSGETACLRYQ